MPTLRGESAWGEQVIWRVYNARERIWPKFIRWHRRLHYIEKHPNEVNWGMDPIRVDLEHEIGNAKLKHLERVHRRHPHTL